MLISPFAVVAVMAKANVRHGAESVQGLASLPSAEMNERVFSACAGVALRPSTSREATKSDGAILVIGSSPVCDHCKRWMGSGYPRGLPESGHSCRFRGQPRSFAMSAQSSACPKAASRAITFKRLERGLRKICGSCGPANPPLALAILHL